MKLLMLSGDRMAACGKQGAFWYTLEEFHHHWDRIDVICPHVEGAIESLFDNVFFHPNPKGLMTQKKWIEEKGEELVKEHRHSVMTVHEYPPFYNGKGAMALHQQTKVPFVLEVHHIVGWPKAASFSEYIGRLLSRLTLVKESKTAAAVRIVNSSVKNTLLDWGIEETKLTVAPSFYLDANRLKPSSEKKNFDAVFVGRLVANKRLDRILVAMQKLPGATLLVIGDGPLRRKYEELAKNIGVADRVRFIGWLPTQEDVIAHMQQARMLVMASSSEGGPRVVLEAMALGMPVLVTNVGVMPDVIRNSENGLITTGTPEDMAEKIALLLSDEPWRERMSKEAQTILERFNRQTLVEQYATFLKSCVSS